MKGRFAWTLPATRTARELGLPLRVNTLVCVETRDDLLAIVEFVRDPGVERWSLLFFVPVERARLLPSLAPDEAEAVLAWLVEAEQFPGPLKTTEAPCYRQLVAQRWA